MDFTTHSMVSILRRQKGLARILLYALQAKGFTYSAPVDTLSDNECVRAALSIIKALRDRETLC